MTKILTLEEKREVLLNVLRESDDKTAIFGVDRATAKSLIDDGIIHRDTFRFTGGAKLTKRGREFVETLPPKTY